MARCPDCNKFVSLDSEQDPEVSIDVDGEGHVTGSFSIMNACQDCGTEMFTSEFDVNVSASDITRGEDEKTLESFLSECKAKAEEIEKNPDHGEDLEVELEVEESDMERTSRSEGKGRGTRTFYGARVGFTVKATFRGVTSEFEGSVEDDIQASSMDQQY
jgi:hypothetical protein